MLTLQNSSNSIDRLSQSIFNAQIDLNSHQVEAALFDLISEFLLDKDIEAIEKEIGELEAFIEQTEIQLQIKAQEKKRRTMQRAIFEIEEEIEDQRDKLIEELKKAKDQKITTTKLFTIQWEII